MHFHARTRKGTATALLIALTACSGGGAPNATTALLPARSRIVRPAAAGSFYRSMVGVGDSLTAGYQSGGILGAIGVPNPLNSAPPANIIPPGQESGWWADVYEQATSFPPRAMYDPTVSPLPLIAGPGLDNQIVVSATSVIGESKGSESCSADGGFDQSAFSLANLSRVRMNPHSSNVRDLAVPGITLHEALTMTQPLTPTCENLPGSTGLLSAVVNGESGLFYPILGSFVGNVPNPTMVNDAVSLHPSLATVWLGANDVLKFMGTGGRFHGGDLTAAQARADEDAIVRRLQTASLTGTSVVVLNLPDVLDTPYFMNVTVPANAQTCKIQQHFYCLLTQFGVLPAQAKALNDAIAAKYGLMPPGGTCTPTSLTAPCGYLTLPGALAVVSALVAGAPVPNLDPSGPGSGLGAHYITPQFAAEVQDVNNAMNEGIDQSALDTHSTLVNIKAIFDGIASGNPANPYFQLAQVNPGVCCTLVFLGGLVSFDGLHPSNTGYALLAYAVVQALNATFHASIPAVPVKKIYAGDPPYAFPDPYAPQLRGDMKLVRQGRHLVIRYSREHRFPS